MTQSVQQRTLAKTKRNDALYDIWSLVHFASGVGFAFFMTPLIALAILVLWEPFENFVLCPLMARFGIVFGYESLRNSLSDIVFDTLGVLLSVYVLSHFFTAPFQLF